MGRNGGQEEITGSNGRYRQLKGFSKTLVKVLTFLVTGFGVAYLIDLPQLIGLVIRSQVYLPLFLGGTLVLVFLLVPPAAGLRQAYVPWYDWLLTIVVAVATIYPAANYREIFLAGTFGVNTAELVLGLLFIAIICEAVRRTVGITMVVIVVFFLAHARFAHLFGSVLEGPESGLGQVMRFVYLSDQGIFGPILYLGGTVILAFLLFGNFLGVGGGGDKFMKLALSLVGGARGGVAKVAVVSSALVGSITGSPVANVGITGSFTIPMMKRSGYNPVFAGAAEATASTGGLIMPPVMGAVAFVMAEITGLGYARIAAAAFIPGLLYFFSVFMQIHFRAGKENLIGLEKESIPGIKEAFREGWLHLLPFVLLVILLIWLRYSPIWSALLVTAFFIAAKALSKQCSLREAVEAFSSTSVSLAQIIPVIAAAGIIIGSISITGLGINISNSILKVAGGNTTYIVIFSGIAIFILGFGVSMIASYIILATMVAPAMIQGGVPLMAAHMFLLYLGATMFITPPYATAAFTAASIAGANPISTAFQAMRLGIVAYLVPFIFVYNPSLLLIGTVGEIVYNSFTAVCGVIVLSAALEGFLWTPFRMLERVVLFPAGLLITIPGVYTDTAGAVAAVLLCYVNWRRRRAAGIL
jgi:TRAP transporter 4TM/12TM fusion protein